MREAVADNGAAPIRNLCLSPRASNYFYTGSSGTGGVSALSLVGVGGPDGGSFRRYTQTVANTVGNNPYVYWGISGHFAVVTPGVPYTFLVWVRVSRTTTCRVSVTAHTDPTGGGWNSTGSSDTPLTANVWTPLVRTFTSPTGNSWVRPIVEFPSALFPVGATVDVTMATLIAGAQPAVVYADGATPGWQWAGPVDASESVGYPYTLESITGKPLASATTPSLVTITANDPTPLAGLTLYAVYDALDNTLAATNGAVPIASLGNPTHNAISPTATVEIRTQYSTTAILTYFRAGQVGGVGGGYASSTAAGRSIGRHIAASVIDPTGGWAAYTDASAAVGTGTIAGYTAGVALLKLDLGDPSSFTRPVAAYAFQGPHNPTTVGRVMGWLGRRYGGPVPAGY